MLAATCHCGAVRVEVPRKPRRLTNCNCSICRRYGTLWAYYKASEVRITRAPGATSEYTHWEPIRPQEGGRMGVNARNFEPSSLESVHIRLLDGASTWKYLD